MISTRSAADARLRDPILHSAGDGDHMANPDLGAHGWTPSAPLGLSSVSAADDQRHLDGLERLDGNGDGVVQGGLGLAAQGLPELAQALQVAGLESGRGQRQFLVAQPALKQVVRQLGIAQQHGQHLAQQAVFVLSRRMGALAGPGCDQVGAVDSNQRHAALRRAAALSTHRPLVAAQVVVLAHIVQEQVDGRQDDTLGRELVVRRVEADRDLSRLGRWQLAFQQGA